MKKGAMLILGLCLCLSGCGAPEAPEQAADGTPWQEDWVTVGGLLGVETPEGLTHREQNEALAANGMYYATWSAGESESYTNDEGEAADLYDAQIYLLLAGHLSEEEAEETAAEWLHMAEEQYVITETAEETYNGQNFTVLTYTYASETNPYAEGASAFGVYQDFAISVECSCREQFEGDPKETLADFLEHCHYGA